MFLNDIVGVLWSIWPTLNVFKSLLDDFLLARDNKYKSIYDTTVYVYIGGFFFHIIKKPHAKLGK